MNSEELIGVYISESERNREVTKEYINTLDRAFKKFFIISICSLATIIIIVASFLFYLYQYDFSTEVTTTVEQDATDGGNANFINGDGDINNGQAKSN